MSEQEILLKAEEFAKTVTSLNFRLRRATKTLKNCRDTCKDIVEAMGELNGGPKERE